MDMNSSEHMIAVAQLREQVLSLQKQLKLKDGELMKKDIEVLSAGFWLLIVLMANKTDWFVFVSILSDE